MSRTRLVGVVGGMGWESTALYYRYLNQIARERLGGHHGAACVMHSLDFAPLLQAGAAGQWDTVAAAISDAGLGLKAAGAELLLLAANSAHRVAAQVEAAVGLPLLHIADATGEALRRDGRRRVGLLGTRHVTEDGFYVQWLAQRHGIEALVPDGPDRERLHAIVLDELTQGRCCAPSTAFLQALVAKMRARGLEAVVMACTELPLLVNADTALELPWYDTARLHVEAALTAAGIAPRQPSGAVATHRP